MTRIQTLLFTPLPVRRGAFLGALAFFVGASFLGGLLWAFEEAAAV